MYRRSATARLRTLWKQFPAVLVLGARQVGKTTLARQAFPRVPYVDLEEPATRQLFLDDPSFQLERRASKPLILDEAQAVPAVFAALRGLIDRSPRANGRFLLLGSAQPSLVRQVSESLAGRIGVLDLDPLTVSEVAKGRERRSWEEVWLRGGFPRALRQDFREWWESYLRTYLERDLPQLGVGADPLLLRRLLTMLAHAQGGLFKASAIGDSLGVSYHTVQRYVDVLEQTFLLRRLTPYFRNVGKRLVKAPKVYLRDTGLIHHLLNLSTIEMLEDHPVRGASFETFVIEDLLRRERLRHPYTQAHFWRTAAGGEVDLVLDRGSERILVEVKSGRGDKPRVVRNLTQAMADVRVGRAWIVDQAEGVDPVRPGIERRGVAECFAWLP
jgi:predicted AAA+ superfamily ATPase